MSDSLWVVLPTGQRRSGQWIDDTLRQRVLERDMLARTPRVADFPRQRVEVLRGADAEARVVDLFHDRGWTDGLPIIAPTTGRVDGMLRFADRPRAEAVAELEPLGGVATVERIAANAVMAGCQPEYMPVLMAGVAALAEPEFNLRGVQTTDENVAPLLIVNGPIVGSIGLNAGFGVLGPGWRANATIGRAIRLVMNNIGGGWPGVVSFAGLGQAARYSLCVAEDEAGSPWEPLHVEHGHGLKDSTITLARAETVINVTGHLGEIASAMGSAASNFARLHDGTVAVLLAPAEATRLAAEGMGKQDVKQALHAQAGLPAEEWRRSWIANTIAGAARWPDWVAAAERESAPIPAVAGPERITVVVTGGDVPIAQHAVLPSWGFPACRITRAIAVPADLMTEPKA